jgi:hypothetical protein
MAIAPMSQIRALPWVLSLGLLLGAAVCSASEVAPGLAKAGALPKKGVLQPEEVLAEVAGEPVYLPPTDSSGGSTTSYGGYDSTGGYRDGCCAADEAGYCCGDGGCPPGDLWWHCRCGSLWYVGLEGGFAGSLGEASASPEFAFGGELEETFNIGIRVGRWLAPRLRLDASYTLIDEHYDWEAEFPPAGILGDRFLGDLRSHIALVNAYWHPDWFGDRFCTSPYLGAGIGVAVSNLREAAEVTPANTITQIVAGNTVTSFAARATVGIQLPIGPIVTLDLSASAIYLGDIETSGVRTDILTGALQEISPFAFADNVVGTVNLALILTPDAG